MRIDATGRRIKKIAYLLILLAFLATPAFAQESHKGLEDSATPYYDLKKDSIEHWEMVQHIHGHLDPFQLVPFVTNNSLQLELGPAQFRVTIPLW